MKAMLLKEVKKSSIWEDPLVLEEIPLPIPKEREILVKVSTCAVCRTDLDIIEGRLPPTKLPLILGHQIIGRVVERGKGANKFQIGDRVGIAWINYACGICKFCRSGFENLCDNFKATGKDVDGGYSEYITILEAFAYKIPDHYSDEEASPFLCAGSIGYRSIKFANIKNGDNVGLSGFGASGHLVLKMVRYLYPDSKIFVFARREKERELAKELGAYWAGDFEDLPPEKLKVIIDTTPVWKTLLSVLKNLEKGGRLVINAIRKEEHDKVFLTNLNYERDLWLEKEIKSVANVTRKDVEEFLSITEKVTLKPVIEIYKLEEANKALRDLKEGKIRGAKVLKIY